MRDKEAKTMFTPFKKLITNIRLLTLSLASAHKLAVCKEHKSNC